MKYNRFKFRLLCLFHLVIFINVGRSPLMAGQSDTIKSISGKQVVFQPFELKWENSKDSKLTLSFLMDKPAGKDGFITIKDGHFVKPSGERFKIWGVNLAFGACFPDKADASKVADYLTRFGINAVRLHFLDAEWGKERSLMNNKLNHTRQLSVEQLDNLDYFISELKKAGVYIDINLNVGRMYREGDNVPEREILGLAKGATLFDDHLIELQKEYAKQLLTHVNPYTGNAYINEPAVAVVEILNENSLVEAWFSGRLRGKAITPQNGIWIDIPTYYGKELTAKYNKWLKENRTPMDLQVLAKEAGVNPGAEIPRLSPSEFKAASTFRFHTEAKFIIQTEQDFYLGMYRYLKKELGVKSLITANSDADHSKSSYAFLSNASKLDYVDGHVYWHIYGNTSDPITGKERWGRKDNIPMVSVPEMSTVMQLSRSAVEGKPYTVSETNNGSYNDYYCEGIPLTGAYSALQDWDGIFYFALAHVEPNEWNTFRPGGLDLVVDPIRMANMAASGLMFMRNDLKPSDSTVYRGYAENDIIEGIRTQMGGKYFFTPGFSPVIPLIQKTRIASFSRTINDFPEVKDPKKIHSDTGELSWYVNDDQSFVEIAAPKSEALVGFFPQVITKLKHLKVNVKNEFGAITLVSLDNQPLETSGKLLLTATARGGMSGMKWDENLSRITDRGKRPTTIEVVSGEITLSGLVKAQKVVVEPLDGAGNPFKSSSISVRNGSVKIGLGKDVTVWYYLTITR